MGGPGAPLTIYLVGAWIATRKLVVAGGNAVDPVGEPDIDEVGDRRRLLEQVIRAPFDLPARGVEGEPVLLDEGVEVRERAERTQGVDVHGEVVGPEAKGSDPGGVVAGRGQPLILAEGEGPQPSCHEEVRPRGVAVRDRFQEARDQAGGVVRQGGHANLADEDLGTTGLRRLEVTRDQLLLGKLVGTTLGITSLDERSRQDVNVDARQVEGPQSDVVVDHGLSAVCQQRVNSPRHGVQADIVRPHTIKKALERGMRAA
jgi:hypothetical protein